MSSSSNHNPGSRPRRRIAGERKPTRPTDAAGAAASGATPPRPPGSSSGHGLADDSGSGSDGAGSRERRPPRGRAAATADGTTAPGAGGSAAAEGAGPSAGRGRVRTPVLAALAALALALVLVATTGVGVAGLGVRDARVVQQQEDLDRAGRTAVASGERAAAAILAYSHKTLEADRDAAARYMTPEYREKYLDTFQLVLDNAPERRTVVQADVRASGVVHAETDRVNVLLFVNQTTTSTANSGEPQTALNRVVMQMARSGDTWLVDDITTY